jgi:hypothetical protein
LFSGTESTFSFCLLSFSNLLQEYFHVAAQLWSVADLEEEGRSYSLTPSDILCINPNTLNLPIFKSAKDAILNKKIYKHVPILLHETSTLEENTWEIAFLRMFDMTNDSHLFHIKDHLFDINVIENGNASVENNEFLPLYESKLAAMYNHRGATFNGILDEDMYGTRAGTVKPTELDLANPYWTIIPRYWVETREVLSRIPGYWHKGWLSGFRNAISAVADARSVTFTIFPIWGVGNSLPLLFPCSNEASACLLFANFNSFVLDYVAKQKASGGNLNYYIIKQLPLLSPNTYIQQCKWSVDYDFKTETQTLESWLLLRILELTYTAWDLEPFAKDCAYSGPPFLWDEKRRLMLRCELDAAFFHLYFTADKQGEWICAEKLDGAVRDESSKELAELKRYFPIPRQAVEHVMDSFPIVKRKDEAEHGLYRTKEVILEIYDAMAEAIQTGIPYQTKLNPPPADPSCCHPPKPEEFI